MQIDQKYPFHSISGEDTLEKVSGKKEGLSSKEAKKRQEQFGKNKIEEKGGTNPIKLFLKQFKDFLILILFIAAGIAWWADQMADVYIILAVILFNAIMGFTQEYKAEKAIESGYFGMDVYEHEKDLFLKIIHLILSRTIFLSGCRVSRMY